MVQQNRKKKQKTKKTKSFAKLKTTQNEYSSGQIFLFLETPSLVLVLILRKTDECALDNAKNPWTLKRTISLMKSEFKQG